MIQSKLSIDGGASETVCYWTGDGWTLNPNFGMQFYTKHEGYVYMQCEALILNLDAKIMEHEFDENKHQ